MTIVIEDILVSKNILKDDDIHLLNDDIKDITARKFLTSMKIPFSNSRR